MSSDELRFRSYDDSRNAGTQMRYTCLSDLGVRGVLKPVVRSAALLLRGILRREMNASDFVLTIAVPLRLANLVPSKTYVSSHTCGLEHASAAVRYATIRRLIHLIRFPTLPVRFTFAANGIVAHRLGDATNHHLHSHAGPASSWSRTSIWAASDASAPLWLPVCRMHPDHAAPC